MGVVYVNTIVINNLLVAANDNLSLAERGTVAAKVILTGFVIVFSVLAFLIFIIKVYSAIVNAIENKNKKNTASEFNQELKKENISSAKSNDIINNKKTPVAYADSDKEDIPEEVVAVISAAVAVMYGSSDKVRIKNIKKSDTVRSVWAKAGIWDNTRPF